MWLFSPSRVNRSVLSNIRVGLLIVVPLLLTACGFQLRGSTNFPPGMSVVYIDTPDRFSPFYRELTKSIREAELTLADNPIDADTVIRVLSDDTGQRAVSVSARNVPREYEVFYLVHYSVFINNEEVLAPQQFVLTRDYTFDETEVLGKSLEERVLRESIAADLVGLLVQRIGAIN
jgi:LPS-assembly lipoprotein